MATAGTPTDGYDGTVAIMTGGTLGAPTFTNNTFMSNIKINLKKTTNSKGPFIGNNTTFNTTKVEPIEIDLTFTLQAGSDTTRTALLATYNNDTTIAYKIVATDTYQIQGPFKCAELSIEGDSETGWTGTAKLVANGAMTKNEFAPLT